MAPAIQQAIENGVPVVTIDRRVDAVEGILAHVGADNVKGGEAQGQWILDNFPDGARIVNLQGQPGASPGDRPQPGRPQRPRRHDGYEFIVEQTANFARDQGLSVTESILAGLSEPPDVIVAANDDMALGAHRGVRRAGARGHRDPGLRRAARGPGRGPRRRPGRHGRAVPGRAEPAGHADMVEYLRDGKEPADAEVLLTPIAITEDNIDEAERLGELN
jgi:inositol transport system substrate-binding protein